MDEICQSTSKLQMHYPLTWQSYFWEFGLQIYQQTQEIMHIQGYSPAALFIIDKVWKQPRRR